MKCLAIIKAFTNLLGFACALIISPMATSLVGQRRDLNDSGESNNLAKTPRK
jgi:hypothetical protein